MSIDMVQLESFLRRAPFWLNMLIWLALSLLTVAVILFVGWLFPSCIHQAA
jgi:uncharacterized membrane protein YhaH (DUF805 family)